MQQPAHGFAGELRGEDTVAADDGSVVGASMMALPADIDPDARRHAVRASSRRDLVLR